ncbi:hypothetical protein [Polyangium jinanense]|uniref:Phosphatidate phosphatase APP1 catalytic domain-containing protein n=1 Tax=Polyangium jinanense TaxID=2829994 RepID=A0A9X4AQT8_9BACT|nr:hypothetical protein [Polyangium jinanense]MDC3954403.1 hypothetical protein [Polyangium jinanense]MDC3980706.1 hypothetical protein [Polyangium jinanense]
MVPDDFDKAAADAKIATIERLLAGHTDRTEEARILDLLRGARPRELDHLLGRLPLKRLFSSIDDRVVGPDNRTPLFRLLCEERLADLSIPTRAALVFALQRGRTGSADEAAIGTILLGTRGAELTALKNAIDDGGDYRDLQQLIYRDLDDDLLRERLLEHFRVAAVPRADLKVLSDIDDTLYPNWKDTRYPRTKEPRPYPGVRAFYHELDLAFAPQDGLGDLTFLTARPGDRAGLGEGITRKHLTALGLPYAKVLTGDFGHIATHDLMADKKYGSFIEYRKLFPEYTFVFCGDSGQGDAIAGARMMEHPGGGMRAVFIHDVVNTNAEGRAAWRAKGVAFNDTYIGHALDAHLVGLLSLAALRRVADAALRDLRDVPFDDLTQREARWTEFRRDIERVNVLLSEDTRLSL